MPGPFLTPRPNLTPRQRLTYLAHLYKALARQHHRQLWNLLRAHVPPDGVVIDAGAHAGQFAKLFAALAPSGQVYAFEPGAYALSILARVVRWRRLRQVTLVPLALSDAAGTARLAMPIKPSGSLGFGLAHLGPPVGNDRGRAVTQETVRATTLDNFVRETALERLDFVKADIEGWEVRLLCGGRESLARHRPAVMVELVAAHLARAGTDATEAWDILAPLGYTAVRLADGRPAPGFVGDGDYLFVATDSQDLGGGRLGLAPQPRGVETVEPALAGEMTGQGA